MVLRSQYLSRACGERSRPEPESLKPPNGVAMVERSKEFTHTVPPRSAEEFVAKFAADVAVLGRVRIATVGGRYFAMDRDKRWDRVEKAYRAIVLGEGEHGSDALAVIEQSYARNASDEFVPPTVIGPYRGMSDGDGLLMGNFRADRAREILHALADPAFADIERPQLPAYSALLGVAVLLAIADYVTQGAPTFDGVHEGDTSSMSER